LVLGLLALICGTVAGFESTLRTAAPNASDFGYASAFEGASSHAAAAADCSKGCAVEPAVNSATQSTSAEMSETLGRPMAGLADTDGRAWR